MIFCSTFLVSCRSYTCDENSENIQAHTNGVPSFRYRDNSVHEHECSPFWVGIILTFTKENYNVYCFM